MNPEDSIEKEFNRILNEYLDWIRIHHEKKKKTIMEDLKLCMDCKYFLGCTTPVPLGCLPSIPQCLRTEIKEPVLGSSIFQYCIECRSDGNKCGREGKWWESKEVETKAP